MPRTLVRAPEHDRLRSLGVLACEWIEFFVRHGPGAVQGMEISLGDEYAGFVTDAYALLPEGKRCYDHCFLSRPKGLWAPAALGRGGPEAPLTPIRAD